MAKAKAAPVAKVKSHEEIAEASGGEFPRMLYGADKNGNLVNITVNDEDALAAKKREGWVDEPDDVEDCNDTHEQSKSFAVRRTVKRVRPPKGHVEEETAPAGAPAAAPAADKKKKK